MNQFKIIHFIKFECFATKFIVQKNLLNKISQFVYNDLLFLCVQINLQDAHHDLQDCHSSR